MLSACRVEESETIMADDHSSDLSLEGVQSVVETPPVRDLPTREAMLWSKESKSWHGGPKKKLPEKLQGKKSGECEFEQGFKKR